MKKRAWGSGLAAMSLAGVGLCCGSGCSSAADDCARAQDCPAGTGLDPKCQGDPATDPAVVSADCGVFVSAAAPPGGDGSKAKPFATLQEGIDHAGGRRVYACVSGVFHEAVRLSAGIEVVGGFDCDDGWTFRPEARSSLEGPPDAIALTLTGEASGARVRGFAIRAADATVPGGSSIAVAVADIPAELLQIDVTAGNGMSGTDGEMPAAPPLNGAGAPIAAALGGPSDACTPPASVAGGAPGVTACEDGEARGGLGGSGGPVASSTEGQSGLPGTPAPESNPDGLGLGGQGETSGQSCMEGQPGHPGAPGEPGLGGAGGDLTLEGIRGGEGAAGATGRPGQGGGGGGGTQYGSFCPGPLNSIIAGAGASGGGGGAGGCGGRGGGGGKAGGSSIGILSLGTSLTLADVTIALGVAGAGGDGALGQTGGYPGAGAPGGAASDASASSIAGCRGGDGGLGGSGGPGGGGRGGYAVGIAYASPPSAAPAWKSFLPGTPGSGGITPSAMPTTAAAGGAGACWSFTTDTGCGD